VNRAEDFIRVSLDADLVLDAILVPARGENIKAIKSAILSGQLLFDLDLVPQVFNKTVLRAKSSVHRMELTLTSVKGSVAVPADVRTAMTELVEETLKPMIEFGLNERLQKGYNLWTADMPPPFQGLSPSLDLKLEKRAVRLGASLDM